MLSTIVLLFSYETYVENALQLGDRAMDYIAVGLVVALAVTGWMQFHKFTRQRNFSAAFVMAAVNAVVLGFLTVGSLFLFSPLTIWPAHIVAFAVALSSLVYAGWQVHRAR